MFCNTGGVRGGALVNWVRLTRQASSISSEIFGRNHRSKLGQHLTVVPFRNVNSRNNKKSNFNNIYICIYIHNVYDNM